MKETFKAVAKKTATGMQIETKARSFSILLDEPAEIGGTDTGMSPAEALLCTLGACQTVCANVFAKSQGIDLKGFHVELEGDLDADGFMGKDANIRNGYSEIRFKMHFDTDASQEKVEQFADFIESRCPIGDNLKNGVALVRVGVVIDK